MADDSELIAAIYDAIIDPSRRDEVARRIVEATSLSRDGCCYERIDYINSAPGQSTSSCTSSVSRGTIRYSCVTQWL